jgi:hypothetical protein
VEGEARRRKISLVDLRLRSNEATLRVNQFGTRGSVGGTPTDATGTVALP